MRTLIKLQATGNVPEVVKLVTAFYTNGNRALQIVDDLTEEPILVASVNPEIVLMHDDIAIKNWSENIGIEEELIRLELIAPKPHMYIPSGFVNIPIYKITDKLAAIH